MQNQTTYREQHSISFEGSLHQQQFDRFRCIRRFKAAYHAQTMLKKRAKNQILNMPARSTKCDFREKRKDISKVNNV